MYSVKTLQAIAEAAVASEASSGIPAELSAAQCILESGWLDHAPGNNCHGIKAYSGASGRQLLSTTEWFTNDELSAFLKLGDERTASPILKGGVPRTSGKRTLYAVRDWFAVFLTLADCFRKHADMLLAIQFYRSATAKYASDRDLRGYIETIAAKYATSPIYAAQIEALIAQGNVRAAIQSARKAQSGIPNG